MTTPMPNVVPGEAAEAARAFVLEHRDAGWIEPGDIVSRLLASGHGDAFSPDVRKKRLKTWALQVLKRLRKRGWLDAPGPEGWPPTAALRACTDRRDLSGRAPRRAKVEAPAVPTPSPVPPPSSGAWETYVQDWIFRHRDSTFGVAEISAAVVQGGFGFGPISDRLDGAREIVEAELHTLHQDGLLRFDERTELWQPTSLLRSWPAAE